MSSCTSERARDIGFPFCFFFPCSQMELPLSFHLGFLQDQNFKLWNSKFETGGIPGLSLRKNPFYPHPCLNTIFSNCGFINSPFEFATFGTLFKTTANLSPKWHPGGCLPEIFQIRSIFCTIFVRSRYWAGRVASSSVARPPKNICPQKL